MSAPLSAAECQRYRRHLSLPEIGEPGQQRLKDGSVLLVGVGGLGSAAALYLAAAGVGRLGLVDHDVVDVSNLQRQILYGDAHVGTSKVAAAHERLRGSNPFITIETHATRLSAANALAIARDYDVVIDGADNFATHYLINDACNLLAKPCVFGSIQGFAGQVAVFDGRDGPCYRCLYPQPPPAASAPSCADTGVLGVVPGVIGVVQATEALKFILHIGTPLRGRLLLFNAWDMRWRELTLAQDPDCSLCGLRPSITQLHESMEYCSMSNASDDTVKTLEISPQELVSVIDSVCLIDVREPHEWDTGHLNGAQLIPLKTLPEQANRLPRDRDIVLYCKAGMRSLQALQVLRGMGFTRVQSLAGGVYAWRQDVDPSFSV